MRNNVCKINKTGHQWSEEIKAYNRTEEAQKRGEQMDRKKLK